MRILLVCVMLSAILCGSEPQNTQQSQNIEQIVTPQAQQPVAQYGEDPPSPARRAWNAVCRQFPSWCNNGNVAYDPPRQINIYEINQQPAQNENQEEEEDQRCCPCCPCSPAEATIKAALITGGATVIAAFASGLIAVTVTECE